MFVKAAMRARRGERAALPTRAAGEGIDARRAEVERRMARSATAGGRGQSYEMVEAVEEEEEEAEEERRE